MFDCKICSENPFGVFGASGGSKPRPKPSGAKGKKKQGRSEAQSGVLGRKEARTELEISSQVEMWMASLHERAARKMGEPELERILRQVAKSTSAAADPVHQQSDECVWWFGDCTELEGEPAVLVRDSNPGEPGRLVYVTRMLVFLFADDESVARIHRCTARDGPLKTTCGRKYCVNITHVCCEDPAVVPY